MIASSTTQGDGTASSGYLADRCIEQAALSEALLDRSELLRGYGHQQAAAGLRVTHQCELRVVDAHVHARAKGFFIAQRTGGAETARQVFARSFQHRNGAGADLGTNARSDAHF